MDGADVMITLTLNEYQWLLLMLGYATAKAREKDIALSYRFLELANAVGRNNPHWVPYQIPEEFQSKSVTTSD
jgi:hypothetical protein